MGYFKDALSAFVEYSEHVQKIISCLTVSGMVAFVAFTIVSARELDVARCDVGDGGTDVTFESMSYALFALFFVVIAAVAYGGFKVETEKKDTKELNFWDLKRMWTFFMRLALNEAPLITVAYVFYMTIASKCPQSFTVDTQSEMDLNFIDEAAVFSAYLIIGIAGALVFHIAASAARASKNAGYGRRDVYENLMFALSFLLITIGSSYGATYYDKEHWEDLDVNATGITNATDLSASCTGAGALSNEVDMSWSRKKDPGRLLYIFLAVFAAVHCVVTMAVNVVKYDLNGEKKQIIRTVVEPIAQSAIVILGMLVIVPLAFALKNPPCNYAFTNFIHDKNGTMGLAMLVIGYTLFVGQATLKTYREFANPDEKIGQEKSNALLLG